MKKILNLLVCYNYTPLCWLYSVLRIVLCVVTAGVIGGLSERYRPRHLRVLSDVLRLG